MVYKDLYGVEIFGSGICNLNCKYCYIPKISTSRDIQKKILCIIDDLSFIDHIKKITPDIKALSFWGAEPHFSLEKISDKMEEIFDQLKSLREISFSTNFTNDISTLLYFINKLPRGRGLSFSLQISIDGNKEINDRNRGEGTTEKIIENLYKFSEAINDIDLDDIKIEVKFKTTWSVSSLRYFDSDIERNTVDYFFFFKKIHDTLMEKNRNKNVVYTVTHWGNFEWPGQYTVEDGRLFCKVTDGFYREYNKLFGNIYPDIYFIQSYKKLLDDVQKLYTNHRGFTCSAGRTQLGIGLDDKYHMCHRTFMLQSDEGLEQDNRLCSNLVKEKYISDFSDMRRFQYVMSGYHDFVKLKLNNVIILIREMAECGQVLAKYKNYTEAYFLALFILSSTLCHCEHVLNTGSLHIFPLSAIRLFGNGVVDIFLEIIKCQKTKSC